MIDRPWLATPGDTAAHLSGEFVLARHLEYLTERVARGVVRGGMRLVVEMPPRHGKTVHTSQWTPAWFLALWPQKRVILASYEADFAEQHGRAVRVILEAHGKDLRVELDARTTAARRWNTTAGGGMQTAGAGGPITGKGADLFVVDDPVKNHEDALSEVSRDKLWNWWQSVARTRVEPRGSVIVIMTRWHEDDLVGRLLRQARDVPGAEQWERVRFPAICETPSTWDAELNGPYEDEIGRREGDALWPERYDVAALRTLEAGMTSHWWASLFQQSPIPIGDAMLRREWFPRTSLPCVRGARRCRMWDFAGSTRKRSDWTVGALVAHDRGQGRTVIEDVRRVRMQPGDVERLVAATAREDGVDVKVRVQQDPGQAGKAQIAHYVRLLAGYDVDGYQLSGGKVVRAGPLAAQAQHGHVEVLAGAWNEAFWDEVSVFPNGRWDDQVDASSAGFDVVAGARRRLFGPPRPSGSVDASRDVFDDIGLARAPTEILGW